MNKIKVKIKTWLAQQKNMPREMVGIILNKTDKAIEFEGYGLIKERHYCLRCGQELQNKISKLIGIGPICAEKLGVCRAIDLEDLNEEEVKKIANKMKKKKFKEWLPLSQVKLESLQGSQIEEITEEMVEEAIIETKKEKINKVLDYKFEDEKEYIVIKFPYDEELIKKAKGLSNRIFDGETKNWNVPLLPILYEEVIKVFPNFIITDILKEKIKEKKGQLLKSTKQEGTIKIPGLPEGMDLYPYQKAGVEFIEEKGGRALLADEMGLGKTIQAIAWMQLHPDVRPVLIVCPASLKINWSDEINAWLTKNKKVKILEGRENQSLTGTEADIYICNYDIVSYRVEDLIGLNIQLMVLDESHYIKNKDTKRTVTITTLANKNKDINEAIKKYQKMKKSKKVKKEDIKIDSTKMRILKEHQVDHIISITGTPIENKPIEIFTNLNMLLPEEFDNSFWFGKKYCDGHQKRVGKARYVWDFNGSSNLPELKQRLREKIMVRRFKKDVLKELPDKQRKRFRVELENLSEYKRAERDFIAWLMEKDPRKAQKAKKAEALVKMNELQQLAIKGKMKAVKEEIDSFIESGEKLIIFAHHKKVINSLVEHYNKGKGKNIAVKITGEVKEKDRDRAVKSFQKDPDIKLFFGNMQAAGVGLTLTAASNVLFIEMGWSPGLHFQAEDRAHRIGQENAVTCTYMLGKDTIDEKIFAKVADKQSVIDEAIGGGKMEIEGKEKVFATEDSVVNNVLDSYIQEGKKKHEMQKAL
ncbi:MAG: SNF2-related protein [bacterium]